MSATEKSNTLSTLLVLTLIPKQYPQLLVDHGGIGHLFGSVFQSLQQRQQVGHNISRGRTCLAVGFTDGLKAKQNNLTKSSSQMLQNPYPDGQVASLVRVLPHNAHPALGGHADVGLL